MTVFLVVSLVFVVASYCSKNCDCMGEENNGLGLMEEIKQLYLFDKDGFNSQGYDKYGYDKDGFNRYGYDKLGYKK